MGYLFIHFSGGVMKIILFFILALLFQSNLMANGPVILVGGNLIPDEVFEWTLKYKVDSDCLLVSEYCRIGEKWDKLLELEKNVQVIKPKQLCEEHLENLGAIFIDGGSQKNYLIMDKSVLQAAHNIGVPILGTSASAMILSEFYFSARKGTINSDEVNNCEDKITIEHDFLKIRPLKGAIIDSHYTKRKRQKRLELFLNRCDAVKGIGIDESTALCITDKFEVLGKGKVHIIDETSGGFVYSKLP